MLGIPSNVCNPPTLGGVLDGFSKQRVKTAAQALVAWPQAYAGGLGPGCQAGGLSMLIRGYPKLGS